MEQHEKTAKTTLFILKTENETGKVVRYRLVSGDNQDPIISESKIPDMVRAIKAEGYDPKTVCLKNPFKSSGYQTLSPAQKARFFQEAGLPRVKKIKKAK